MSSFLSKRLALAVISIVSAPVGAATVFEVNTFQDAVDASLGVTCATVTGACSLRAAIQEANNQASTGPHTIKLPAGIYNLSLQGSDDIAAAGDLDINSSMIIEGFGADKTIIQLASSVVNTEYRVFHIGATSGSPIVTIKGVTIKGGMSSQGAGINLQTGTLNLNDSQVDSNNANQGSGALGGGIYSNGILKLSGSTISNNTVANNSFGQGGAIYVSAQAAATYVTNSTISTNTVSGLQGGGIYNASSGTFVIASSTITQNAVNASGTGGSGIFNAATSANVRLKNTILAQNRSNGGSSIPDCSGPLASDGYNLVGLAPMGGVCTFSPASADQVGLVFGVSLNAVLGNLALNGGTVTSHLPGSGSPAIELGNPAGCTSAESVALTTDQRGYVRASLSSGATPGLQGRCDIGAVEYNSAYTAASILGGSGPLAGPQAFTAYFNTPSSGSLLGANPDLLKTDSSAKLSVTNCSGSGTTSSSTGFVFCRDPSVTPRGLVGINAVTGYFVYEPNGQTGTDSFGYFVQNASGQRASGVVSINISNSGATTLTPPVVPAAGVTISAKVGNKTRAALPFVDPDKGTAQFVVTFATSPSKGTAVVVPNNPDPYVYDSVYLEYTPFDAATGVDTFSLNISDGSSTSQLTVNVNIGTGTTTVSGAALVAIGALIKEDVSRTQPTSLSDFSSVLRNPSNVVVTLAKSTDPVGSTGALLGTVAYSNGVFTFTPPVGGVSAADNRASFRINGTYSEAGTLRTLPEVTVTLNFAVAGASTIPVPNQFSSPATVPRTSGGTFSSATASPLLTSITLPSGATSIVFDVSNSASGTFGNSASSSLGRVDVSTPSNGAFLYTVTSGTAVTANQDTFYYRVRYTDSLGNPVTTTSAVMFLNFIGAPAVPVAGPYSAFLVARTGFNSIQNLSTSVTSLPQIAVFEVSLNGSSWASSAVSTLGTLNLTSTSSGSFSYTPVGGSVPTTALSDVFQYRVRYTDASNQSVTTAAASLTLNFGAAATGNPRPVSNSGYHAMLGATVTIPLKYVPSAGGGTDQPVSGTLYLITVLPQKGKLFAGDVEITSSNMTTINATAQVRYIANVGAAAGADTFTFKVREPVAGTSPLSYLETLTPGVISLEVGTMAASTPLEEGGGGSLSPLALLAMLALYGRRRFH